MKNRNIKSIESCTKISYMGVIFGIKNTFIYVMHVIIIDQSKFIVIFDKAKHEVIVWTLTNKRKSSVVDPSTITQMSGRVVVLVNHTSRVIHLKESRRFAPDGVYSHTIQLDPFGHKKKIGANMFHRRAKEAARPTVIRIFVDGVECINKILTPQAFIDFFQISFWINEEGEVIVRGFRATHTADQLQRIRYLLITVICLNFCTWIILNFHFWFMVIRLIGSLIKGLRSLLGSDDRGGQEEDIAWSLS